MSNEFQYPPLFSFLELNPEMDADKVAADNRVRALTVVASGVVAIYAAFKGRNKLATGALIYAAAQTLTIALHHSQANQEPGLQFEPLIGL